MTIAQLLDQFDGNRSIVVVNPPELDPVLSMLGDTVTKSARDVVSGRTRKAGTRSANRDERVDGGRSGHNPNSRPNTTCWISLVPSPISISFASR